MHRPPSVPSLFRSDGVVRKTPSKSPASRDTSTKSSTKKKPRSKKKLRASSAKKRAKSTSDIPTIERSGDEPVAKTKKSRKTGSSKGLKVRSSSTPRKKKMEGNEKRLQKKATKFNDEGAYAPHEMMTTWLNPLDQ